MDTLAGSISSLGVHVFKHKINSPIICVTEDNDDHNYLHIDFILLSTNIYVHKPVLLFHCNQHGTNLVK